MKDWNILALLNLVTGIKRKDMRREEARKTLLFNRWQSTTATCLNEDQIADVIWKTLRQLKVHFHWDMKIQEEDKKFIDDLYLLLVSCPDQLIENAKLSAFFENLLRTSHTLETIIAATMHNIQPRASGSNIKNFTGINEWYRRLDRRYNFSLAPALLPLMTTDNLKELESRKPPFLEEVDDAVNCKHSDNTCGTQDEGKK